jgi:hypothetical protein
MSIAEKLYLYLVLIVVLQEEYKMVEAVYALYKNLGFTVNDSRPLARDITILTRNLYEKGRSYNDSIYYSGYNSFSGRKVRTGAFSIYLDINDQYGLKISRDIYHELKRCYALCDYLGIEFNRIFPEIKAKFSVNNVDCYIVEKVTCLGDLCLREDGNYDGDTYYSFYLEFQQCIRNIDRRILNYVIDDHACNIGIRKDFSYVLLDYGCITKNILRDIGA